ncbi:PPK2 family polyphosphate kinase [Myroides pelagicus]|uniref:Polyphosphate kinase 2 family protein n=1 Tax=Myroides pelagicus TaxID=270914 RepID=A0A7K1GMM8_9FLAO|nr:PPK2 family polyphosphate kinase [Myroides pelagicus]MEC4113152.1 PPK2 family polyphosphate kinase [Myroides pelagicus]MTH29799.1 polyphosphate kinase 2 family protein [Myroides pelagicus]
MSFAKKYIAKEGFELSGCSTKPDFDMKPKKAVRKLDEVSRKLGKLQDIMYAHNRYSVLICLQGMDAAGKDSLIREVFKSFNARGVDVQSFKRPTSYELRHDYLWRHFVTLPEKGKYTVFNRSHYENVLVSRVHPEIVLNERIPGIEVITDIDEMFWDKRYEEIQNFEKHISNNGVIVFKFFLHMSKDEQKSRILRRLNKDKHNWKFEPADVKEREFWEEYQRYYQIAIEKTSTDEAPWYVIPADDKDVCRFILASILDEVMSTYTDIVVPELSDTLKEDLVLYKDQLLNEE